jgi:hypothetical protein
MRSVAPRRAKDVPGLDRGRQDRPKMGAIPLRKIRKLFELPSQMTAQHDIAEWKDPVFDF